MKTTLLQALTELSSLVANLPDDPPSVPTVDVASTLAQVRAKLDDANALLATLG